MRRGIRTGAKGEEGEREREREEWEREMKEGESEKGDKGGD